MHSQEHPYIVHIFTESLKYIYKSRNVHGKHCTHNSMPILYIHSVNTQGPSSDLTAVTQFLGVRTGSNLSGNTFVLTNIVSTFKRTNNHWIRLHVY